jgi:hypothetical protein
MSEKMIKGYKGFNKGLICRDKQYAENTVFNEDKATLCESGMHFCKNPLNVLNYYSYYNSEIKSFSEYAEVEAPEDVTESKGDKSVTKQLKIGSKISFDELIKAGVEFNLSKEKFDKEKSVATGKYSGASATGDYSGASAVGRYSGASATGDYSGASTVGRYSGASATGDYSGASTVGGCSGASATGDYSGASTVGGCSGASATGDYSGASTVGWRSGAMVVGDYSGAMVVGDCSGASATGRRSGAMVVGDCSGASATGRRSGAMVVGDDSQAMCKNNSVAVAIGRNSMAKGDIGCYIVLTEVKWDFETDTNKIIDCKCFKVDGEIIKADTFYKLVDGKPVVAE